MRDRSRERIKERSPKKERSRERSREKDRDKYRDRDGGRSRSKERDRGRNRDRDGDRSRSGGRRSISPRYHSHERRYRDTSPRWKHDSDEDRRDGESFIEYRKRKRDTTEASPVWASSPSRSPPPRSPKSKSKRKDIRSEKSLDEPKETKSVSTEEDNNKREAREHKDAERAKEDKDKKHESKKEKDSGKKRETKSKKKVKKDKKSKKNHSSPSPSASDSESSENDSSSSDSERSHKKKDKKREKEEDIGIDLDDPITSSFWTEKKPNQELAEQPIGPRPLAVVQQPLNYGGQMLPGEAEAIAQFVQQNKRIPRRGEVGLTSDEIEHFEDVGFVMSGSRHKRMNAIRIRKENQVYSAEEKRALAMFNYEEKAKRENKILAEFRDMLSSRMGEISKDPSK